METITTYTKQQISGDVHETVEYSEELAGY